MLRRSAALLLFVVCAGAITGGASAGTFHRTITFRWPAHANQSALYTYSFTSPHVRSISFRSYGATISAGLAGDQLVACFHRGPASLNWAWSQAATGLVTLKVRAITGACDPGPSVAGTTGSVTLTIVTTGGPPSPIATGSGSAISSGTLTMPRGKHYHAFLSDTIVCSISASVFCQTFDPPQVVAMHPNGKLDMCSGANCHLAGMLGATVTEVPHGKPVTVGRFRCSSSETGVTCVALASGRGFTISRETVQSVGG